MVHVFTAIYAGCFLLAMILFLNLVAQAFSKSFLWGVICLLVPPGTYTYCKKNWAASKQLAISILILLASGAVFQLLARAI